MVFKDTLLCRAVSRVTASLGSNPATQARSPPAAFGVHEAAPHLALQPPPPPPAGSPATTPAPSPARRSPLDVGVVVFQGVVVVLPVLQDGLDEAA